MRNIYIVISLFCLPAFSALAQVNTIPQTVADSSQVRNFNGGPGMPPMTVGQQVAQLDYNMSKAVLGLTDKQTNKIHKLDKKFIKTLNKDNEDGNRPSGQMGGSPMAGGMGGGMRGGMGGGMMGGGPGGMGGGMMDGGPGGMGGSMGGNSMDGGSLGSNAPQQGSAPKGMPAKGAKVQDGSQMLADSVDFEAIEKFRTAKEAYEKSLRKILTPEQFGQYKAFDKAHNSSPNFIQRQHPNILKESHDQ
jgi:hypothetical protein